MYAHTQQWKNKVSQLQKEKDQMQEVLMGILRKNIRKTDNKSTNL